MGYSLQLVAKKSKHLIVAESEMVDAIFFWIRWGMLGSTEQFSRFF